MHDPDGKFGLGAIDHFTVDVSGKISRMVVSARISLTLKTSPAGRVRESVSPSRSSAVNQLPPDRFSYKPRHARSLWLHYH